MIDGAIKVIFFSFVFNFSVCFGLQSVHAETDCGSFFDALPSDILVEGAYDNSVSAVAACRAASPTGACYALNKSSGASVVYGWAWYVAASGPEQHWYPFNAYSVILSCSPSGSDPDFFIPDSDSDDDGIPDEYDAYPDDPLPYQFRIISRWVDSQGNIVGTAIVTSKGDYVLMSDFTISELNAGVSSGTYSPQYVNSQIWQDSTDLIPGGGGTTTTTENMPSGTANTPLTSTDAVGLITDAERNVTAQTPTTPSVSGSGTSDSQGRSTGDSDSDSFGKIVGNTDASNQNLKRISDSLGITNDLLAIVNSKIGSGSGNFSDGVQDSFPTAEDIGQSVKDNLIDSSQTIDTTSTDNISALDRTETLTSINTKYSGRFDSFITTLKGSDLFSLPFGIFAGPSGSGSSIQTVNIGKWGSSTDQTATIDYSDYDNIWDILRTVLLLLTSFSCFKILVLKKG
ncbi:hypothetical protein [Desulfobacter postgatei]|uniref:Uncharacterized protein n=1 Tax=Desulfobacter postgatei 2ac9 TaxID=879212 RepID=I5AY21_9BACT|nr:hypothetical protein [Desulfobacter postgatei]EIM62134.1 hypothetical protein DespoDRAFT_00088 [Desulfobacter postgatei 2ac9]